MLSKEELEKVIKSIAHERQLSDDVIASITQGSLITMDAEESLFKQKVPFGDRLADRVANFGGSWPFIITFFAFIVVWMIINSILLMNKAYDPYPFILLNLILSCLAAIQAPIIMMSQNRKESKDRLRSENDLKIDLKAEIEIQLLHKKIDKLFMVLDKEHHLNQGDC